jgi:hypothetical protein
MTVLTTRKQFLALGIVALSASVALAAPHAEPEAQAKRMLEAIKTKSYEEFLADADDKMRMALTKPQFDGVCGLLSGRLQQGYKTSYLGKLRQQGFDTHLWKLEPADGKDEHLVKMSVKDGKVGGFFIQ